MIRNLLIVGCLSGLLAFQALGQKLQPQSPIRFLSLGDSYTIGESVSVAGRWPNQLRDSLQVRGFQVDSTAIVATTGWTTGNLLNDISGQVLPQEGFNLVSLLIGVNNQFQGQDVNLYRTQFQQLLDSALWYANYDSSAVFVLSIPDYAFTPFGQNSNPTSISAGIDLYNSINDSITAAYGLPYFDITPISRQGLADPSLVATDGLHPSAAQYTEWVKLILEDIDHAFPTAATHIPDHTNGLRTFPNPSSGQVTLDGLPETDDLVVQVVNVQGKLVFQQKSGHRSTVELDLDLPKGIYWIQVSGGQTEKLIITH